MSRYRDQSSEYLTKARDGAGNPYSLTYAHGAVHRDVIVNLTDYVATAAGRTYLFRTGSPLQAHLTYRVICDKACTLTVYESPTVTDPGTELTPLRLFRPSKKTNQVKVYHTPTTSANGTQISKISNGGGGVGATATGGSLIHDDAEWVLKVDTDYLFVVADGATITFTFEAEWYEVPQIGE